MKSVYKFLFLLLAIIFVSCNSQKADSKNNNLVYNSDNLKIVKLSDNVYQHISYLNTESFGKVDCNGMIVKDGDKVVIFDTPTNDKSSAELIFWIKNDLGSKINAVIPTHFHNDCLGGLKEFSKNNIPSYSNNTTIELAKKNGGNVPDHGFDNQLFLTVGNQKVIAKFYGEGHTKDNIIGYFPKEKMMFGGCLIKELQATKGYLGDANVSAWSATVEKVKADYPDVKTVIPGHGKIGGKELLDYTIQLFRNN